MKKTLYLILSLLMVNFYLHAQETPPAGLKAINAQFYIHLPDSTIWQQKGTPYNWHRVAKYSELQAMGLLYLLKTDTVVFKRKSDSTANSGYVTHGYFNANAPVYTASQGIMKVGNDFQFGGPFTGSRNLYTTSGDFTLGYYGAGVIQHFLTFDQYQMGIRSSNFIKNANTGVSSDGDHLTLSYATSTKSNVLVVDTAGIYARNSTTNKGVQLDTTNGGFSPAYNSLIPKYYADSHYGAAGSGVTSFNSRTGAVTPLNSDYPGKVDTTITVNGKRLSKSVTLLQGDIRDKINTVLYSANFATISSDFNNPGGWTTTTGGITATATGLANYIQLNKDYNLYKRVFSSTVTFASNSVVNFFTKEIENNVSLATITEVDASAGQLRIYAAYNGSGTYPSVIASKAYAIVAGRDYEVRMIRDQYINGIKIIDKVTGLADSLYDYSNTTGRQYDSYCLAVKSGTFPVVKSFNVYTPIKKNPKLLSYGDSIWDGIYLAPDTNARASQLTLNDMGGIGGLSGRGGGNIVGLQNKVLTEMAILMPQAVMITIGTNGPFTQAALTTLVNSIKALGIRTVYVNHIPWRANNANITVNSDIDAVRTALVLKGINYDIATSKNFLNTVIDSAVYNSDGGVYVHPTKAGQIRMWQRTRIDLPELYQDNNYGLVQGDLLRIGANPIMGTAFPTVNTLGTSLAIERISSTGTPSIILAGHDGTITAPTATGANRQFGAIVARGGINTTSAVSNGGGGLYFTSINAFTSSDNGTKAEIAVTPIGSIQQRYRFRVTPYGQTVAYKTLDVATAITDTTSDLITNLASVSALSIRGGSTVNYIDGTGAAQVFPATPGAANPTGTIGLTAVNGSANTYIRSDAAPALSQAIAPTWTAQHIFSGSFSASAGLARATPWVPTLTATANGDLLIGIDINPTYTVGAFTGVSSIALRAKGDIRFSSDNNYTVGAAAATASTLYTRGIIGNSANDLRISSQGVTGIVLQSGSTSNTYFKMFGNGHVVMQNVGTFTDAGFWLDVQGTARFTGDITTSGRFITPKLQGYTVATLPAGTVGMLAYVTDALTPAALAIVVGGGASVVPVFFNGTNWIVQ